MSMPKRKPTSDAVEILHRRFIKGNQRKLAMLAREHEKADIAREIYDLRTAAGLSQAELARKVRTTASVICRLEDADYGGHSLRMLRRIAAALNRRVQINFVPVLPKAA
jgi:ribosome-binding protein aMBF1 (putative translation factor)